MATLRNYTPARGFFQEVANSREMHGILRSIAEDAKVIAQRLSEPIRSSREHPHYADSFEVSTDTIAWTGEHPGPRAAGRLTNTSGHAAAVEWGYRGSAAAPNETSAHRILGRTLAALADVPYGRPE